MDNSPEKKEEKYNILSIIGFIFAFIFQPAGFILGIIALSQIKKEGEKGKGLAIAAVTIGAVFFVLIFFLIIIWSSWVFTRTNLKVMNNEIGFSIDSRCLFSKVLVSDVFELEKNVFEITLLREEGTSEMGGVELIFTDKYLNENYTTSFSGDMVQSTSKTVQATVASNVPNVNRVGVIVYFLDGSGNKHFCPTVFYPLDTNKKN